MSAPGLSNAWISPALDEDPGRDRRSAFLDDHADCKTLPGVRSAAVNAEPTPPAVLDPPPTPLIPMSPPVGSVLLPV